MKNASKDSPCQANHCPLVSRPNARRLVCLILSGSLPLLLGAECGLETCDIFNCDTLPFIEELLAPNEHTEDAHDDEDGQMDMEDGEEHVDDDTQDDEEDEQRVDDEEMPDDEDGHMDDGLDEGMNGDDHDADAEDHDEDEEG